MLFLLQMKLIAIISFSLASNKQITINKRYRTSAISPLRHAIPLWIPKLRKLIRTRVFFDLCDSSNNLISYKYNNDVPIILVKGDYNWGSC